MPEHTVSAFARPVKRPCWEPNSKKLYVRKGEDRSSPEHLMSRLAAGCVEAASGCWEWQRTRNNFGYGMLTVGGRAKQAHRLMLELVTGEKAGDRDTCHHCDNPRCINPKHLFFGTRSENMRDCSRKGRAKPYRGGFPRGTNPAAKLSEASVAKIRDLLASGETQQTVADRFGISQSQVSNIARGEQWKP